MVDLDERAKSATLGDVGRLSPEAQQLLRHVIWPIVRLCHRPVLEGAENLPEQGPYLLVANHSAGLGVAEILTFASLAATRLSHVRIAGFAHPTSFRFWPTNVLLRHFGAIPSTYEAADRTLTSGVPILVFPGGDHETLRPIWQAHRVDFGGRLGFLKIARKAGVPVVPMGIRGSHFTAPMLIRSKLLSVGLLAPRYLLGTKRWALSLLGLVGALGLCATPVSWPVRIALIYAWLGSPLVMAPYIPATIRIRIGEPLSPESLFREGTDEELPRALDRVQGVIQGLVTGESQASLLGPRNSES
ncbi:MAG: 1-acyl-sn-glycerol-3-phosphate acyltransferase [Deltaproteobacteria bacterium]|nr:1-acyl-sn-glycerol-3-phosphate acyltransferase [Deltaproteobacteria bacterium]